MDKNKLIENIKAQLKSLMTNEVKFAEVKAGDLMITSQDEVLVVGSEVFTIDADGNNVPLSDGDYTLDSGEVITVVSGKIEGMVTTTPEEVEAVEEEVDETETPEQAEEPAVEEEVEVEDEDEMGKNKMAKMEERLAKCEKMLEEMGKEKAAMEQKLSKISNEPSSASISVEPAEFKSVENKKDSIGSFDITELRAKIRSNR
jgi:hypothetical protein